MKSQIRMDLAGLGLLLHNLSAAALLVLLYGCASQPPTSGTPFTVTDPAQIKIGLPISSLTSALGEPELEEQRSGVVDSVIQVFHFRDESKHKWLYVESIDNELNAYVRSSTFPESLTDYDHRARHAIMPGLSNQAHVTHVLGAPTGKIRFPSNMIPFLTEQKLDLQPPMPQSDAGAAWVYSYLGDTGYRRFGKMLAIQFDATGDVSATGEYAMGDYAIGDAPFVHPQFQERSIERITVLPLLDRRVDKSLDTDLDKNLRNVFERVFKLMEKSVESSAETYARINPSAPALNVSEDVATNIIEVFEFSDAGAKGPILQMPSRAIVKASMEARKLAVAISSAEFSGVPISIDEKEKGSDENWVNAMGSADSEVMLLIVLTKLEREAKGLIKTQRIGKAEVVGYLFDRSTGELLWEDDGAAETPPYGILLAAMLDDEALYGAILELVQSMIVNLALNKAS